MKGTIDAAELTERLKSLLEEAEETKRYFCEQREYDVARKKDGEIDAYRTLLEICTPVEKVKAA